ncbi:NAD-glutamate dehydrogenase domain-containing protein [Amphritea sp. HPY]|uniref:NAD-glutamate dehydrogenase domain-containing protein n=1 Tax=Amphritea sp. HPY TaxID=3421652 RepID=UPI003D7EB789
MISPNKNNNRSQTEIQNREESSVSSPVIGCWFTEDPLNQSQVSFCVAGKDSLLALSELLPILENMGVTVISASSSEAMNIENASETIADASWSIVFKLQSELCDLAGSRSLQLNFQQLFMAVIRGEVENDGFNRLIAIADVSIAELVLLRAVSKYLLQINVPFSQAYMEQVLTRHSDIAVLLIRLFCIKFEPQAGGPAAQRTTVIEPQQQSILACLDQVTKRDEDRILRSYFSVFNAMLRTNFYQLLSTGNSRRGLSFKLRAKQIEGMPLPAPEFETFVYSPRVEGVHLRGGKVSRGGIRWSDRREDFRTEILGLVKAQMVKNAVIVPVGAKGGFVVKNDDSSRGVTDNMVACYSEFISALLDITDNLKGGEVTPPADVIRYDDDDPYLVVAADKGTATLSDVANGIAESYNFWLGDAFASGGANGYDHKKMGITARGAWQSTRRLFKETGIDSQAQEFTTIAIGDMSGDVFGNGMLLSQHIRLVAAFNHQHIFIDPNPGAKASYLERKRLFELPRSSWLDYSAALISTGGGVFSRNAKRITLTDEIRSLCNIGPEHKAISPDLLIRYLLSAPADLLWNGGIGTYIKSATESNQEVGDRANDAVRIDATEVKFRVIVEGGNLGLTQLARIEFANNGGRVNTDAIDNSGGVDCSDHEVNIKILLQQLLDENVINPAQRNQLLDSMTDDVAELVLRNNYQQSKMLSQSNHTSLLFIDKHAQLIQLLEKEQLLNRQLECLPDDASIEERIKSKQGLTRPEIAVLLAYSKTHLFNKLVNSNIIEDELIRDELFNYFPPVIRQRYPEYIRNHPLGKEILAAQITNQVANRMGATFCNNLLEENKTDTARWVKSHIAARKIFGTAELAREIEALGFAVSNSLQMELYLKLHFPMEKAARWLLKHADDEFKTRKIVDHYTGWVDYVRCNLLQLLSEEEVKAYQHEVQNLVLQGIPAGIAEALSALDYLYHALDIAIIANVNHLEMEQVVSSYFRLNGELDLFWLRRNLNAIPVYDKWYRKAKDVMSENMDHAVRNRVQRLLKQSANNEPDSLPVSCLHYSELLNEIKSQPNPNLATVTVAIEQINTLM